MYCWARARRKAIGRAPMASWMPWPSGSRASTAAPRSWRIFASSLHAGGGQQLGRRPRAERLVAVAVARHEDPVGREAAAELGVVDAVARRSKRACGGSTAPPSRSRRSRPAGCRRRSRRRPFRGCAREAQTGRADVARGARRTDDAREPAPRRRSRGPPGRLAHPLGRPVRREPSPGVPATRFRGDVIAHGARAAWRWQARATPRPRPRSDPKSPFGDSGNGLARERCFGRVGPHAVGALGESLALDPERPVEARPVVLERDHVRQLDQLRLVELCA